MQNDRLKSTRSLPAHGSRTRPGQQNQNIPSTRLKRPPKGEGSACQNRPSMSDPLDDSSLLAVLRRKKETLENAIRILEEYQNLVGAHDSQTPLPSELNAARVVELLLQRDLFPRD